MCCFALSPPGQASPVSYIMTFPWRSIAIASPWPMSSMCSVQPSVLRGRHKGNVSNTLPAIHTAGIDFQARKRQAIIANQGRQVTSCQRSSISIHPSGSSFKSQKSTSSDLSARNQTFASSNVSSHRCNSMPARISGTEINVTSGTAKRLATRDEMLMP
ncbi:hypothetical protein D3C85_1307480 [compost metagenome]